MHTLASRFIILTLCTAVVLSTLAYGTVHYWSLAIFEIGACILVILWMVDAWRSRTFRISRSVLQWPLVGLILLGLVQLLPLRSYEGGAAAGALSAPPVSSLSIDPYSTRLAIVQIATLLIYFAAALAFIDSPKRLRLIVRTVTIFGFLLAIFGLIQSFTSPDKIYWLKELPQSTPFGPFYNRHHFAAYMELAMALPLGLLFSRAIEPDKRPLYIFAAAMMGIALIATGSRGGMISLVAEVAFLVMIGGVRRQHGAETGARGSRVRSALVRAGLALGLVLALIGGALIFGGEEALSRMVGTVNSEDPTTGRAHFWGVTLEIIRAHPVVGSGLGSYGLAYTQYDSRNGLYRLEQAHNDFLQTMSDAGIVGVGLGLFFIFALFRTGFARRETDDAFRRGVATGALAGSFAVLVHSLFDFTLHTAANSLLFLMLVALATINGRVEEASQPRRRRRRHRTKAVIQPSIPGLHDSAALPQSPPGR